uniref:CSON003293 protein n=1 Tax=Culicoides sonorensis TaxID=179676 RepID=A0A336ML15_CULSO
MKKLIFSTLVLFLFHLYCAEAQSYEDKRCKCVCPSVNSVINRTINDDARMLIIENVPPSMCNCDGVILPRLSKKNISIEGKEKEFCPRCDCKYENRNTTIIKVVVTIVIFVISILVVYMLFLFLLDPLLNKRMKLNYQEHTNEEDDTASAAGASSNPMQMVFGASTARNEGGSNNVLNRVGAHQDKWKKQVKEQRKNIYDRHSMLN